MQITCGEAKLPADKMDFCLAALDWGTLPFLLNFNNQRFFTFSVGYFKNKKLLWPQVNASFQGEI